MKKLFLTLLFILSNCTNPMNDFKMSMKQLYMVLFKDAINTVSISGQLLDLSSNPIVNATIGLERGVPVYLRMKLKKDLHPPL